MKIGTPIFMIVLLLVGVGFLSSETWHQVQEIHNLNGLLANTQQTIDAERLAKENALTEIQRLTDEVTKLQETLNAEQTKNHDAEIIIQALMEESNTLRYELEQEQVKNQEAIVNIQGLEAQISAMESSLSIASENQDTCPQLTDTQQSSFSPVIPVSVLVGGLATFFYYSPSAISGRRKKLPQNSKTKDSHYVTVHMTREQVKEYAQFRRRNQN